MDFMGYDEEITEKEFAPSRLQIAIESAEVELLEYDFNFFFKSSKQVYFNLSHCERYYLTKNKFKCTHNFLTYNGLHEAIALNAYVDDSLKLSLIPVNKGVGSKPYITAICNLAFDKVLYKKIKRVYAMLGGKETTQNLGFFFGDRLILELVGKE